MNSRHKNLVGSLFLALIVLAFAVWSIAFYMKKTSELQNAGRGNADANVVSGSVKEQRTIAAVSEVNVVQLRMARVPAGPGEVVSHGYIIPDTEGVKLLEAVFDHYSQYGGASHRTFIFSSRRELAAVKSSFEWSGWTFKEEKSPWSGVFLLTGSQPKKGYRINIGCFEEAEDK